MTMNKTLLKKVQAHAEAEFPRECCGVVIRENGRRVYVPCRNDAQTPSEHFIINPEDQCAAEDRGEVVEIVHSHPNALATPSMADRVSCELHGVPWFILGWPGGDTATIKPEGYEAPLLEREFHHGILDCYALVRDWYAREWGIDLPNFPRRLVERWRKPLRAVLRGGWVLQGRRFVQGRPGRHADRRSRGQHAGSP